MTADEFGAWMDRHRWDDVVAGERLGRHRTNVWQMRNGVRRVPATVAILCGLIDKVVPPPRLPK